MDSLIFGAQGNKKPKINFFNLKKKQKKVSQNFPNKQQG